MTHFLPYVGRHVWPFDAQMRGYDMALYDERLQMDRVAGGWMSSIVGVINCDLSYCHGGRRGIGGDR